jgi:ubiquitin-protein ligase
MKRLLNEFKDSKLLKDKDIELKPHENNIYHWYAKIIGPKDTPFENGVFELDFTLPTEYPNKPPTIKFLTKVFHPNVHWKVFFKKIKKIKKKLKK